MHRKLALLLIVLSFALMPFATSAQSAQSVNVQATGLPDTNEYFYSSEGCNTSADSETYMYRGGPSYTAYGISPTSGAVYEEFNAIGTWAFGKAYFFQEGSNEAFEFWFEGTLTCLRDGSAFVQGEWTFGYAYLFDPEAGQELCTRLDGYGTITHWTDFAREVTTTRISGSYSEGATQPCD
jgi:hypothetical protein